MSPKATIFFGCVLSFFIITELSAQSQKQTINWYTSFFKKGSDRNIDSKLSQAKSELEEAREIHDFTSQSRLLKEIGLINLSSVYAYGEAMGYFIKALTLEDSLGFKEENVFTHLGIAEVFEAIGELEKS